MAHKYPEIGLKDVAVLEDEPRPRYAVADGPPILVCLGHGPLFTVEAVSPVSPPASAINRYFTGERIRRTQRTPQNVLVTP
ncbi:hypothetical protein N657DRAFT_643453 [Parathielavia appendiculata]|uniref:Uncharacterized protein n=1 Tax=Parathielavia appendiculata TaxID=2587402 RepID=A0AAN6U2Q6_9PEZI|nr:hypothetical protein N657DRAFT_643453 [Parathielavia appendiculata]